jgi:hydroxymethylpyrimidine/phosphomethylpyrimidine kinase
MAVCPPVVLTVAGFDPSSGAGVTADVKTIAAHGCYGVSCITALTVQSTMGAKRIEAVKPDLITETLEELVSDVEIAAVHIGMLGAAKVGRALCDFLEKSRLPNIVLDPVIRSSSGADLTGGSGLQLLIDRLMPLATVMTPNIEEAAVLTGLEVTNLEQMRLAATRLHAMGASSVVITGGHLEQAIDLLKSPRHQSNSTHGTGCAFATAMACHLARGRGLPEAVLLSKAYVAAAIANAHPLGRGIGPVHHLYRMHQQRRVVINDPEPAAK